MKKLFVLSAAFLLTLTVNAQTDLASIKKDEAKLKTDRTVIKKEKKEERKELRKLQGKEVASQSKQAFYSDFGNLPVTNWERKGGFDEATFTKGGIVMKAFYDADFNLVGTTTYKAYADIPASAQTEIDKKYQGYTRGDVIFFDDNELNESDMVMFGNQFDDADNYFIDLKKDNKEVILKVNMHGDVSFFKQVK